MFEIPTLNQLVVQIAWLGLDEDAVNETELRAHTVVPRARMQRC